MNDVATRESSHIMEGRVISNKMDKTIIVQVVRTVKHPLYDKYVRRFSKMVAHDEKNTCQVGDIVKIKTSRPLSKTKRWTLVEVMRKEGDQV